MGKHKPPKHKPANPAPDTTAAKPIESPGTNPEEPDHTRTGSKHRQYSPRPQSTRSESAIAWATWLYFAATVSLLTVSTCQLRMTRLALSDSRESSSHSQRNFQTMARAWVGVDRVDLGIGAEHGGLQEFTVFVKNYGSTPASDARGCFKSFWLDRLPPRNHDSCADPSQTVIFPGQAMTYRTPAPLIVARRYVEGGKLQVLYLHGSVRYRPLPDLECTTWYCGYLSATEERVLWCSEGNEEECHAVNSQEPSVGVK